MGKAGRPKKAGAREASGKLQRPSKEERRQADRVRLLGERAFVAGQPHRRGEMSQLAGSVLGRFCLRTKLRPECYEAGLKFAATVAGWRAAKGVPVFSNATPGPAPVPEDPEKTKQRVDGLRKKMVRCEKVLLDVGTESLIAVRQLTLDEFELTWEQDEHAKDGLVALAVELGMMKADEHPFMTGPREDRHLTRVRTPVG